ncbi:10370_t:CDS:1, partial [Rhizophagus irregularis]
PGNFHINSLKLKLKFHYSSNRSKIQWLIKLLPTRKIVKDEYGFILK